VNSEEDAKTIIADLGKGNDFAAVAKAKSLDPGTRDRGGELGWFSPVAMVKPFADAVVKLQKGELAKEPIKTQFGWHVLQLNDARDAQPQPYEKMKDTLQKQIQQRNMEKLVTDLKAKAKIVQGASK
jgi:peptidyl-prolyl cis-trans isomerase C